MTGKKTLRSGVGLLLLLPLAAAGAQEHPADAAGQTTPAPPAEATSADRLQGVQQELDALSEHLKRAQEVQSLLDARLAGARQEAALLRGERDRIQARLDAVVVELDQARQEIKDAEGRITELEAAVEEKAGVEARLKELQDELAGEQTAAQEQQQTLEKQNEALATERDRLREELEASRNRLAEVSAELQRLNADRTALETERDRIREQLARKTESAQAGAQRQEAALRQARQETAVLSTRLEQLESELQAARTEAARFKNLRGAYTVRRSDTLSSIATQFYGKGDQWRKILEANREAIPDPDALEPGTFLLIPE